MYRNLSAFFGLALTSLLVSATTCQADLFLQPIGDRTWDLKTTPIVIELDFRVRSDGLGDLNTMNAFSLGIRFVPMDGAIGGLRLAPNTLSTNAPDRVFPNYNVVSSISELTQTFSADNFSDLNGNNVGDDVTIDELGKFLFRASVVAVDGTMPQGSFSIIADPVLSGYYTESFDELKFVNVPDDGNNSGVAIGSISLVVVPEPAGAIGLSLAVLCSLSWRRRRLVSQRVILADLCAQPRPSHT